MQDNKKGLSCRKAIKNRFKCRTIASILLQYTHTEGETEREGKREKEEEAETSEYF